MSDVVVGRTEDAGGARSPCRPVRHDSAAGCAGRFGEISTRSSPRRSRRTRPSAMSRSRHWQMISAAFCVTSRSAPAPIRCGIERRGSSGDTSRGVAAAAVAVLVLGGLTAFYTNRLATERDRAQREAVKAARVSEALTGLLMGADPIANRATPDGLTVRGLLDAAAERVQKELVDQPEAQAEIFTVIGRMYRRLGMYDKAQHLLERALASGRAAFGPEHASVAQTLNDLGALAAEKGDYKTAAASLESALSIRRRIYGPEHTRCREHACRARPHLPGSRAERACRAASPRGAGDQAESARRRTRGNRRQLERPGVGSAAEWRSRRRRGAASAIAGGESQDSRRGARDDRDDAARCRADHGSQGRPGVCRITLSHRHGHSPQSVGRKPSARRRDAQQPVTDSARPGAI